MEAMFARARDFIYRNARPLELARWRNQFEAAGAQEVLDALRVYQNPDGGFGHGLEPDAWCPLSSPVQTWCAAEVLREAGCLDGGLEPVQGLLRYLTSGQDFDGHTWGNTVPGNNDWPHAPWWHHRSDEEAHDTYNPTASLAGVLLHCAAPGSAGHGLGLRIAEEAAERVQRGAVLEMHELRCYLELAREEFPGKERLMVRLREEVGRTLRAAQAGWEREYVCRPSMLFAGRDDLFCAEHAGLVRRECALIRRTQLHDGSWPLPWRWTDYPEAWPVAQLRWKCEGIIRNLRFLREMEAD